MIRSIGVERLKPQGAAKAYLVYKRTNDKDEQAAIAAGTIDEEKAGQAEQGGHSLDDSAGALEKTTTVFTWKVRLPPLLVESVEDLG